MITIFFYSIYSRAFSPLCEFTFSCCFKSFWSQSIMEYGICVNIYLYICWFFFLLLFILSAFFFILGKIEFIQLNRSPPIIIFHIRRRFSIVSTEYKSIWPMPNDLLYRRNFYKHRYDPTDSNLKDEKILAIKYSIYFDFLSTLSIHTLHLTLYTLSVVYNSYGFSESE